MNTFRNGVRLFNNRSKLTSICLKNRKVALEVQSSVFDLLTTFRRFRLFITVQTHGNRESICFI